MKNKRPLLFVAVGVFNTVFDLVIYIVLLRSGVEIIFANIISTSCALSVSYLLNKRLTFGDRFSSSGTPLKFLVVTLVGLWILQPLVIYGALALMSSSWIAALGSLVSTHQDIIAKLAATAASLVWNYLLYSKYVFKKGDHGGK